MLPILSQIATNIIIILMTNGQKEYYYTSAGHLKYINFYIVDSSGENSILSIKSALYSTVRVFDMHITSTFS